LTLVYVAVSCRDWGTAAGGALCYLKQRDGLPHWLTQRRELRECAAHLPHPD
jgi:hypothetical protein